MNVANLTPPKTTHVFDYQVVVCWTPNVYFPSNLMDGRRTNFQSNSKMETMNRASSSNTHTMYGLNDNAQWQPWFKMNCCGLCRLWLNNRCDDVSRCFGFHLIVYNLDALDWCYWWIWKMARIRFKRSYMNKRMVTRHNVVFHQNGNDIDATLITVFRFSLSPQHHLPLPFPSFPCNRVWWLERSPSIACITSSSLAYMSLCHE